MVGRGKMIPDKDETEIGLPARHYLSSDDKFVLLVDDCEADRSDYIQEIFDRYRRALDTILSLSQSRRASVHFLVNMIIGRLAIPHVLSRQDACSSLRTMFAWIHKAVGEPECEIRDLLVGRYNEVTKGQICALPP